MIKTVVFDIGNVLTSFGWYDFVRSFGFSEDVCVRIDRATLESKYWVEYDRGVWSEEEIISKFISLEPELEKEIRITLKSFTKFLHKCDYAIPWIQELQKRGYRVLYLSNFSEKALVDCAGALTFLPYMDGGVFSYIVKQIKPDREIFETLLEKYSLNPDECVFMDDIQANVDGAIAAGLHAFLFKGYEDARARLEEFLEM